MNREFSTSCIETRLIQMRRSTVERCHRELRSTVLGRGRLHSSPVPDMLERVEAADELVAEHWSTLTSTEDDEGSTSLKSL